MNCPPLPRMPVFSSSSRQSDWRSVSPDPPHGIVRRHGFRRVDLIDGFHRRGWHRLQAKGPAHPPFAIVNQRLVIQGSCGAWRAMAASIST